MEKKLDAIFWLMIAVLGLMFGCWASLMTIQIEIKKFNEKQWVIVEHHTQQLEEE